MKEEILHQIVFFINILPKPYLKARQAEVGSILRKHKLWLPSLFSLA